jgi:purine-binding chemotaxis protein CheW
MQDSDILVFGIERQRFGLMLQVVKRVIPMVEARPLQMAPEVILGVINVQGVLYPVLNLRRKLGFPERTVSSEDRLILCQGSVRKIALAVDDVEGVQSASSDDIVPAESISPELKHPLAGLLKLPDGLILIYDLDTFLTRQEEQLLEAALATNEPE